MQAGILNPTCLKHILWHSHRTIFPVLVVVPFLRCLDWLLWWVPQLLILSLHLFYSSVALPITQAQDMTHLALCPLLLRFRPLHHTVPVASWLVSLHLFSIPKSIHWTVAKMICKNLTHVSSSSPSISLMSLGVLSKSFQQLWGCMSVCPVCSSVVVIKHSDQRRPGEERVCLIFYFTVYHRGKPRQELEAKAMGEDCWLAAPSTHSAASYVVQAHLSRDDTTCSGLGPLYELALGKTLHRHVHRPGVERQFFKWGSLFLNVSSWQPRLATTFPNPITHLLQFCASCLFCSHWSPFWSPNISKAYAFAIPSVWNTCPPDVCSATSIRPSLATYSKMLPHPSSLYLPPLHLPFTQLSYVVLLVRPGQRIVICRLSRSRVAISPFHPHKAVWALFSVWGD